MDSPEGPDQPALFRIEGPDEDGCVWMCSTEGRDVWCQNLGPVGPTAAALANWLGGTHRDEEITAPGAPFKIEGPDDEGCVWICSAAGREVWCQSMGPVGPVATEVERWLVAIDFGDAVPDQS